MPNLQDIFDRIEVAKGEQREIRKVYKDVLASNSEYEQVIDELNTLKARKKQIETAAQNDMSEKWHRYELLARAIADDRELLADAALKDLLAGQIVRVVDSKEAEYEPLFAVRFRKKV